MCEVMYNVLLSNGIRFLQLKEYVQKVIICFMFYEDLHTQFLTQLRNKPDIYCSSSVLE